MTRNTLIIAMGTLLVSLVVLIVLWLSAFGIKGYRATPSPEEVRSNAKSERERKDWFTYYVLTPSSEDVIEAFREAGLEVGHTYPAESETRLLRPPEVYTEATRFVIPSLGRDPLGQDEGGRVFVFDSSEDLKAVRDYYTQASSKTRQRVHLYEKGLVLVQISDDLPEEKSRRYDEVLREM